MSVQKLRPNSTYNFSQQDLEFCIELAKVGSVHLLSNQVELIKRTNPFNSLIFRDYSTESTMKCSGLRLPANWVIEEIRSTDEALQITFGVSQVVEEKDNVVSFPIAS